LNDRERDILRKTILSVIEKGFVRWKDIEKYSTPICWDFATTNTVKRQFYRYLVAQGYVVRVSRGVYGLSGDGERLLLILTNRLKGAFV